jgi:DNA-binding NarL/FixJ family response regulator
VSGPIQAGQEGGQSRHAQGRQQHPAEGQGGSTMIDATAPRPTLLIADDELELQEALQEMLQFGGYDVVGAAGSGTEAIALGKELKPDLALVDYRMPGANGIMVTEAIKRESPHTQVIMFTAYDETSLSLEAAEAGVFAFLVKGCAPSLILQALTSAWDQKKKLDEG